MVNMQDMRKWTPVSYANGDGSDYSLIKVFTVSHLIALLHQTKFCKRTTKATVTLHVQADYLVFKK